MVQVLLSGYFFKKKAKNLTKKMNHILPAQRTPPNLPLETLLRKAVGK